MFRKSLFLILFFSIGFPISCENRKAETKPTLVPNQIAITELNKLIFDELKNGKIVMIGDAYHGHGFFLNKVTNALEYWLKYLENPTNDSLPFKLVLFLEENRTVVKQINLFLKNGDIYNLLKFYVKYDSDVVSNVFTHDYFAFLHKLRLIKQRVEKYKKNNPLIDLQIVGAESKPPFIKENTNNEDFIKKRQLYFAYQRDKLTANNIRDFLIDQPGYKAIVFYGGAHLIREKVDKNNYINRRVVKKPLYSYFLAHYLDSLFSRSDVCVFFERPIFDFKYENILKVSNQNQKPDYYVSSKPYPNHSFPMTFARSKTYYRALLDLFTKYKNQDKNDRLYKSLLFKLTNAVIYSYLNENIEMNKDIFNIAKEVEIKSGELINRYSITEFLNSCDQGLTIQIEEDNSYNNNLLKVLSNIPAFNIDWKTLTNQKIDTLPDEIIQKITDNKDNLAVYWAIHSLFIADRDESKEIMHYLSKKLNLSFKTKLDWLNWWNTRYIPSEIEGV